MGGGPAVINIEDDMRQSYLDYAMSGNIEY